MTSFPSFRLCFPIASCKAFPSFTCEAIEKISRKEKKFAQIAIYGWVPDLQSPLMRLSPIPKNQ
ncbi:putative uncharacterized protein [Waddlia chondrophila 2032/99]|uniref:Uncharacterized protein n=2 Tax=Waddlia chondrophila TaxID=71667 RepID=D6YTM9_WADCW|nr:hypothetical protein wcw_0115 [Waddlia chondrophila WSU 86-1044]CCB90495.1 putative uncharacterized protein [Waddlia chondrophila 2032/99]